MTMANLLLRVFNNLPLPTYPYRMYMHRHRCIFIHIPKCAGSSILKALGHTGGRDHVEWRHYQGANPKWFKHYFKFAICRHPLDRLKSGYEYVIKGGNGSNQDLELQRYVKDHCEDFNAFIQTVLDHAFISENILFKQQYLFVFNREGKCQADSILRYEQLDQDWVKMAATKGYPQTLAKTNTSQKATKDLNKLAKTLSVDALNKVEYLYHNDFVYFQYPLANQ